MTATADRNTKSSYTFREIELQLAASQTIYQGTMVCRNATGYAVPGRNTAGLKLAGVSKGDKRNGTSTVISDASTPYYVAMDRVGAFLFTAAGLTIADIGKRVYLASDDTVQLAPTNVFAGYLVGIESATEAWVDISEATHDMDDSEDGPGNIVDAPVAASTTLAANQLVGTNATGYLVSAHSATCRRFLGVTATLADNGAGADGDISVQVYRKGVFSMTSSGLSQADVGKQVYASAASTVTLTPNGQPPVGVLEEFTTATAAQLRIDAAGEVANSVGGNPGKMFTLHFCHTGAAIAATPLYAQQDFELPCRFRVLRGYADARVAPGGSYYTTITLTDGTTSFAITITGAAVHGENETQQATPFLADTDLDVTLVSDNGSAITEDVKIMYVCEALN
jgi:predicted RecA/RadA family phage recombinase